MSNATKQAVYDAAQRFVGNADSTDELEEALSAHKKDESKPASKRSSTKANGGTNGDDGA